jgi:hypothetical protein
VLAATAAVPTPHRIVTVCRVAAIYLAAFATALSVAAIEDLQSPSRTFDHLGAGFWAEVAGFLTITVAAALARPSNRAEAAQNDGREHLAIQLWTPE